MARRDHSWRVGNLLAAASTEEVPETVLALIYARIIDKRIDSKRLAALMPAAQRGELCMEHWNATPCFPCVRRERHRLRTVSATLARRVRKTHGDRCYYCGAPASEIDHVIPFARGGRTKEGNLVPACRRCNIGRSDLLLVEWAWRPLTRLAYRRLRKQGSALP